MIVKRGPSDRYYMTEEKSLMRATYSDDEEKKTQVV